MPSDRHGNLNLLFGLALGCLGLQGTGLGASEAAVLGFRRCTQVPNLGGVAAFTQRLNVVYIHAVRQRTVGLFVGPSRLVAL